VEEFVAPDELQAVTYIDWRTAEGLEKATRAGVNVLMQELAYVPSSNHKAKTLQESDEHTNQQHRNDPLKVMNAAEKEWDQLDTWLARYD
jgi:hypothetical protein